MFANGKTMAKLARISNVLAQMQADCTNTAKETRATDLIGACAIKQRVNVSAKMDTTGIQSTNHANSCPNAQGEATAAMGRGRVINIQANAPARLAALARGVSIKCVPGRAPQECFSATNKKRYAAVMAYAEEVVASASAIKVA